VRSTAAGTACTPRETSLCAIDREPALTAAAAVEAAPHPGNRHRVLASEGATVLYRQIDNFSLEHPVMFDWLDEVLDQLPGRQGAKWLIERLRPNT
jgi:hypothetical protein